MSTSKLTYEDCLQLKNAGFPQKRNIGSCFWNYFEKADKPHWGVWQNGIGTDADGKKFTLHDEVMNDMHYIPTLSELVEACGEEFYSLVKQDNSDGWKCFSQTDLGNTIAVTTGSSPEQAVKNLWIALNK